MNDGKAGLALELFSKALALDSEYAELQYFMGRCYLGLSRTDEARAHFEKARDLDTLRFRADSKINGILRHAAGQFSGDRLVLVDAAAAVAKQSGQGSFLSRIISGSPLALSERLGNSPSIRRFSRRKRRPQDGPEGIPSNGGGPASLRSGLL